MKKQLRDQRVELRVTKSEKAYIVKLAKKAKVSITQFLINLLP